MWFLGFWTPNFVVSPLTSQLPQPMPFGFARRKWLSAPARRRMSCTSCCQAKFLERDGGSLRKPAEACGSLRNHPDFLGKTMKKTMVSCRCSLPTVTNPLNDDEMMIPSWLAYWVETSSILEVQTDKDMSMEVGAVGDFFLWLNFSVSINFCPLLGATVPPTWNITPSFGIDPVQYGSFL